MEAEDFVKDNKEQIEELLLKLLNYNTQNPPGKTDEIVKEVKNVFEGYEGSKVEIIESEEEKPNIIVEVDGFKDENLIFNGHLDTVPFSKPSWEFNPLGEVKDKKIYGRGAADMKGAVTSMIYALKYYLVTGKKPTYNLKLILVTDEETGGQAGLSTVFDEKDLDAELCIIGEKSCSEGELSFTIADRGDIWIELIAHTHGGHGSRPALGNNSIKRLYESVEELEEFLNKKYISQSSEVEEILDESIRFYNKKIGWEESEKLFENPTFNLGVLRGGNKINSVPEEAHAKIDIRFNPGVETGPILDEINQFMDSKEFISLREISNTTGTFENPDSEEINKLKEILEKLSGLKPYARCATGGGSTARYRKKGIPAVEFARATDSVHSSDEYITQEILCFNTIAYIKIIEEF